MTRLLVRRHHYHRTPFYVNYEGSLVFPYGFVSPVKKQNEVKITVPNSGEPKPSNQPRQVAVPLTQEGCIANSKHDVDNLQHKESNILSQNFQDFSFLFIVY